MVTHIVFFKFESSDDAQEAVTRLLSMKGQVASLLDIEAGLDFTRSARSFDIALITRHKTRADLDAYQADPFHLKVAEFIKSKATGAAAVDFEGE